MPRFNSNRWWIFILTIITLHVAVLSLASWSFADVIRESSWTPGADATLGGGGAPPPTGVGDPDQPVNTSLKYYQRQSVRSGGLSVRAAGDRRIDGNVWMLRLSVMGRVLRIYGIYGFRY